MDLCNLEKDEEVPDVPELLSYEDLIEKYANFLTIEEYINVVMYENDGNMLEFWDIILIGINEKIKFLTSITDAELLEGAKEEIESELAAVTLLTIQNTRLSDSEQSKLQTIIETPDDIMAAKRLMELSKGSSSKKYKKSRKTRKSRKSKKSRKTRKTRKSKRQKLRTNKKRKKRKNRRIKTGGVAVGNEDEPARNVWNPIDFTKFKSNIGFYIRRLGILLGIISEDALQKRHSGQPEAVDFIDGKPPDNGLNGVEGDDIDKINADIGLAQAENAVKSAHEAMGNKVIDPEEARIMVEETERALEEARKVAEAEAKELKRKGIIETNKGYFILGKCLGRGGSFKSPFQLLYCKRDAAIHHSIRDLLKNRENFNVNEISRIHQKLFFIDFEDIIKDQGCEVFWNERNVNDVRRADPRETIYLLKSYIFLKIDNFNCSRRDICDEYELGKKLFNVKYDDGISLSPRPLEIYYKRMDGNIILDDRFDKQEYGIRSGEFTYTVCKTCNTEQTSDNRKPGTSIPNRHFEKIAKAFHTLIFDLGYLTTDIKPDNMCMTRNNSHAQVIDFDEVQFFDKRWSHLRNKGPGKVNTTGINHKKAALCYMILQYISTYYIHNLAFRQLYRSSFQQSTLFIKSLKETLNYASTIKGVNLNLKNFFCNGHGGKDFRDYLSDIDFIIGKPKINDGCNAGEHDIPGRFRKGCAYMFQHYHRSIQTQIGGSYILVSLSPAIEFICSRADF